VDRFVANCLCRASKVPRDKTPGLLQPLPVAEQPWRDLVMDFKSMPKDKKGYNNVFVIVDRLTKSCWTIPCQDTVTAPIAAQLFYEGPYRIFGLPRSIVSDRGPQFASEFQYELSKILGIAWKLSTSGHSQTAGQAEIMNEYIDQRLRLYVNHYQDNWAQMMPALDAV
jgi:transposase InsO family protein